MKKLFLVTSILFATFTVASAQRTSVSTSEVTGTFRLYFSGGTKGDYNQAKISSIGSCIFQPENLLSSIFLHSVGSSEAIAFVDIKQIQKSRNVRVNLFFIVISSLFYSYG